MARGGAEDSAGVAPPTAAVGNGMPPCPDANQGIDVGMTPVIPDRDVQAVGGLEDAGGGRQELPSAAAGPVLLDAEAGAAAAAGMGLGVYDGTEAGQQRDQDAEMGRHRGGLLFSFVWRMEC